MSLKLLLLALVAITGIGLTSLTATSAYAQTQPDNNPNCRINCNDDDDDDDHGKNGDCYDLCLGSTIPGNKRGREECTIDIDALGKVSAGQIRRIGPTDPVKVVKVCESMNLVQQQKGVENIRWAIARNDRMDEVLDEHGFTAADVVGVMMGPQRAVLYVHVVF